MLVFNILSSVCSWALRALPLNTAGTVIISLMALANVAFSLLAAWALMKDPAPGEVQPPAASAGAGSSASTSSTSE
jgi:hypothetical protein